MSDVNLTDFKKLYLSTAQDYIRKLESSIGILIQQPTNVEAIEEAHISAHSLKSQSLVMGYQATGELSHNIEIILRKVVDGEMQLLEKTIQDIQKAIAALHQSVTHIEQEGKELDVSQYSQVLRELSTA